MNRASPSLLHCLLRTIQAFVLASVFLASACVTRPSDGDSPGPLKGKDPSGLDLEQTLPLDGKVRTGVLKNGMRWYIQPVYDTGSTLSMRLLVDAGSVNEAPDQKGMAHFVEHMAFNGTKNFPAGSLLKAGFQDNKNGFTGFDRTMYVQDISSSDTELLKSSFLVFQDYAQGLLFDPGEVEKERGVIHEEWRRSYANDSWAKDFALAYADSPYAQSLPIGTEDSILHTPLERIRDFYDTWYRPERMTVVITGPLDPDRIQAMIEEYLAPVKSHGKQDGKTASAIQGIPDRTQAQATVGSWTECPNGAFLLFNPRTSISGQTVGKLRSEILGRVLSAAYQSRFKRLELLGNPVMSQALLTKDASLRVKGKDFYLWGVVPQGGKILDNFDYFARETQRLVREGFEQDEFEAALKQVRADLDAEHQNALKREPAFYADRICNHVSYDDLLADPDQEFETAAQLMNSLDLASLNKAARFWLDTSHVAAWIKTPQNDSNIPPALFMTSLDAAKKAELQALGELKRDADLASVYPPAGTIVKEEELEDIDAWVWTLSNGAKVYWRKMDGSPRIALRAARLGGLGTIPDEQIMSAQAMLTLRYCSGLGNLDADAYRAWLNQKNTKIDYWLNDYAQGYVASAKDENLEDLFQALYQESTRNSFKDSDFENCYQNLDNYLKVAERNWNVALGFHIQDLRAGDNPRLAAWTPERLQEADNNACSQIWQRLYGNAEGWVYMICGNAETDTVKDYVQRYLAALPGSASTSQSYPQSWFAPSQTMSENYILPGIGASRVHLECTGFDDPYPQQNDFVLETARTVLQNRLFARIRENMSASYDPSVSVGHDDWPRAKWILAIDFACEKGREDELIKAVKEEIKSIATAPLTAAELEKFKETMAAANNSLTFGYEGWAERMEFFALRGMDPSVIPDLASKVDDLTISQIASWMTDGLLKDNWIQVILVDER